MHACFEHEICVRVHGCGRVGAGENVRECESETEGKTEMIFLTYLFIYF